MMHAMESQSQWWASLRPLWFQLAGGYQWAVVQVAPM